MGQSGPASVTPNRRTHVIVDSSQSTLVQPAFSYERVYNQIGKGQSSKRINVSQWAGVGWQIKSYWDTKSFAAERTEGQAGFIADTDCAVAGGILYKYGNRKLTNTEITGVATGGSANVATQSNPHFLKAWASSDDTSTLVLTADQTAFPSPDTSDPNYVMDRQVATTASYSVDAQFTFNILLFGGGDNSSDGLATFYFPGPAGQTATYNSSGVPTATEQGIGQYALKLYGDGRAKLFERKQDGTWLDRATVTYSAPANVFSHSHLFLITTSTASSFAGGPGGTIVIRRGIATFGNNPLGNLVNSAIAALTLNDHDTTGQDFVYAVPRVNESAIPRYDCQLRVDVRRDLRNVRFSLAVPHYFDTGTIQDENITIPGVVSQDNNLTLQWDGDTPGDSTIDAKVYNALTNTELSVVSTFGNGKIYAVPALGTLGPLKMIYVKLTLTASSSKTQTPRLRSYKVYRDGLYASTGTTPFDLLDTDSDTHVIRHAVTQYSVNGPERDFTQERASISAADLTNTLSTLNLRTSRPIRIETEYDPADATKRFVLFDGYTDQIDATRITGGKVRAYPSTNAKHYDIQANGHWQRLRESLFYSVQQTFYDYNTGQPVKVTDLVKAVLQYAGYPSSQISVPDSPVLLFGKGNSQAFAISALLNCADVVQKLLADYLGWFLVWDPNAGSAGLWRALAPTYAPYTNVAAFITSGPPQSDGQTRLVHSTAAYPLASTLGDGLTYTATAPTIFIDREAPLRTWNAPPEANMIHVSCMGVISAGGAKKWHTTTLVNPKSFNFDPNNPTADTTSPDYLGRLKPLYYMNPSLAGAGVTEAGAANAIKWVARRLYDVAAHNVSLVSFQAPIVPLVHELDSSKRRSFRFYDPVTVDGVQYLVRNFNPNCEKDSVQMAMFQLEKPNF